MPLNTRGKIKRHADEALNDLARATDHLKEIAKTYGLTHPDHKLAVDSVISIVETAAEYLAAIRDKFM